MEFSRNVLRKVYARPKLRQKVSRRDVTRTQTWKRSALNRTKAFRVNGNAYILDEEALSPTIVSSTSRSETSLRRIPRTMTRRTRGETTLSAREMTDPQHTRAKSHKRVVESSAVDFIVHVEAFCVSNESSFGNFYARPDAPSRRCRRAINERAKLLQQRRRCISLLSFFVKGTFDNLCDDLRRSFSKLKAIAV